MTSLLRDVEKSELYGFAFYLCVGLGNVVERSKFELVRKYFYPISALAEWGLCT